MENLETEEKKSFTSTLSASKPTKSIQYILVLLSIFYTAYFAKTLILPIFIGLFLAMSLTPISTRIQALRLPKPISSIIAIILFLLFITLTTIYISEPLKEWASKLPRATESIAEQIKEASLPLADKINTDDKSSIRLLDRAMTAIMSMMASSTPALLAQVLATLVLAYFFLCYGEDILRKTVTIRDSFSDKKITVEIARSIQSDISFYLLTILVINILLGCTVALIFYLLGIKDPIFWGFLAMMLNFAPFLGPLVMFILLIVLGIIEYSTIFMVFMPALVYLCVNLLEANFVTPVALGKRLNLNPLIVLIWLFIWGWIWGAAGFLLGVPMLVCFKIIAQQTGIFGNWIYLLEESDSNHMFTR